MNLDLQFEKELFLLLMKEKIIEDDGDPSGITSSMSRKLIFGL